MTVQLHDTGEEYIIRKTFTEDLGTVTGVDIGLYNDSTDALADSDDVGAITTEPAGSNYGRISLSFGTGDFTAQDTSGDWEAVFSDAGSDLTYTTDDSSQTVDSAFVVVTFQANDTGDGSQQDHLLFTLDLEDSQGNSVSRDLSQIDTLDLTASTGGLSIN